MDKSWCCFVRPSCLQERSVSSHWRWRSLDPCRLSSRRCWRTLRAWRAARRAAGPAAPPQAAAAPACPPARPKAVQPHSHHRDGPLVFTVFFSSCRLQTERRGGRGKGRWASILTADHRRLAETPPSLHHTPILPPPDTSPHLLICLLSLWNTVRTGGGRYGGLRLGWTGPDRSGPDRDGTRDEPRKHRLLLLFLHLPQSHRR